MRVPCLSSRQPQTQGREHRGDFISQGFDVCLVTMHEYDEIVRLCRPAYYPDRGVSGLVGGVGTAGWSA
jgi:hypothetical protein